MWLDLFSLQRNLEKTIYLASIFHEIGHRAGPFRISPAKRLGLKVDDERLNILGELATDSLLVQHLAEFPEILHFVIFQRLFWFGRMGFRNNPVQAKFERRRFYIFAVLSLGSATTSPAVVSIPFASEKVMAAFEGLGTTINAWQPTFSAGIYDQKKQRLAAETAVSYASDLNLENRTVGKVATLTGRSLGQRTVDTTLVERVDYECSLIRKK